jgi:glycosyltransferase involved in cell wall biosynthesis
VKNIKKLLFVVNVDWFFLSHRLPIALEAMNLGYEVHIATGITKHFQEMESFGLIVHPLSIHRSDTSLISAIKLTFEIFQVYKSVKPDIVHLVTIKPVILGGIVARIAKTPGVVAAISGFGFVFTDSSLRARIIRVMASQIYPLALKHNNARIIVQNPSDFEKIQKIAKISPSIIRLIPGSGVDLEEFSFKPERSLVPVVMMPCRMLVSKGVKEFVNAARYISKEGIQARFVLVGDTDPANPASLSRQQLETWHRESVIEWWGHCTKMPDVLTQAHVVVLPSYGEGLPKILVEAAACGRPIVTTDIPGCRAAIEPDVTGFLVPVKDTGSLAAAIKNLLMNPKLRSDMGAAGRKRAESIFSIEKIVSDHLNIYHELEQNLFGNKCSNQIE